MDAWRARRTGYRAPVASPDARWPLVTIQWLFAIIYFSAAMSKVVAGGIAWFAPSTIQYYLVEDGLLHHIPLAFAAAQFPAVAAASALFAVVYQALFWTGLIWRRALPFLLLGGIVMHSGIYVLQRANFLEYAFVALVFVDPIRRFVLDWAASRVIRRVLPRSPQTSVLGHCARGCTSSRPQARSSPAMTPVVRSRVSCLC
ncbi:MAG: hypothetical protein M3154_00400 [Candidatus Eremiobacteraeota bacterium]|nr:hypothetical protein [Candidatus Eremiobacteraeota bacterium]